MGFRLHTFSKNTLSGDTHILQNGVRLAFIQSDESTKSVKKVCLCLSLSQGHFHSANFPEGFAHLYEHMLFNASGKYKNANALDNHLFAYNGHVDGWTQDLSTHFQISCDIDGFEQACDILINRLTHPLFLCVDIEKEIVAIEAEFNAKKDDTVRQLLSVQKATCNPLHPFSRFSVGNAATLGALPTQEIQKLLKDYHLKVSQGHHVSVCVGLPYNMQSDVLAQAIKQKLSRAFSPVTHQQSNVQSLNHEKKLLKPKYDPTVPVYLPRQLNKFVQISNAQSRHQLITSYLLSKELSGQTNERDSGLYIMLCHLLESKHEGGLYHLLKSLDVANNIQSYCKSIDPRNDELVVSIQLTSTGATIPHTVFGYVQAYIDYLRRSKIEAWRFREKTSQYSLNQHIHKGTSLFDQCTQVSARINEHGLAYAFKEGSFLTQSTLQEQTASHEPWQLMPKLLSKLDKRIARVYFISPLAATNKHAEHYNTPYSELPLLTQSGQSLPKISFSKPRQNPYMANEYPLVKKQIEATSLIQINSAQTSFKFYQNLQFMLPSGECYISITEPQMYSNVKQMAAKRIWLLCLNEHLSSRFFDAELANIHFRVYAHQHGVTIHTGGLSERQLLLCIELINAIIDFKASKNSITPHLHLTLQSMTDKIKQRSVNQLFSRLNEYYLPEHRKQAALLQGLNELSVEAILEQQNHYFKHTFVESMLIGNWQVASADRFCKQLNSRFQTRSRLSKPVVISPPILSGEHVHITCTAEHEASIVRHFIPLLSDLEKARLATSKSLKLAVSARSLILEKLLSHTLFDVLRQQRKMGYELGVGYKPIARYPGVAMYAVSQTHTVEDIFTGMQDAIYSAKTMLEQNKVAVEDLVKELIRQVEPKETNISQTASRAWLHFEDNNPITAYSDLVNALSKIDKGEVIAALDKFANSNMGQVVLSASNNEVASLPKFEADMADFSLTSKPIQGYQ
jgi:secreted Zn-dependent insulinase-like peptidase